MSTWSLFLILSLAVFATPQIGAETKERSYSNNDLPADGSPGCLINREFVRPGTRGIEHSYVVECQQYDGGIRTQVVACLDGNIYYKDGASGSDKSPRGEHPAGDQWPEGDGPFRFLVECADQVDGKKLSVLTRRFVQCVYNGQPIQPGQQIQADGKRIGCERTTQYFGLKYVVTNTTSAVNDDSNSGKYEVMAKL